MVVLAIVAGGVVYRRWQESGFDWRQFAAIFSQMNWFWILVTALLNLATYAGRTVRWAIMLRPLKLRPSYWNLFKATAIGFTAVILFGRPGELVRPYLVAAREGVAFASQLAAGFLDRIYDLLALALIFGLGLSQVRVTDAKLGPGLSWVLSTGGYVMAAIAAGCLLALAVFHRFYGQLQERATAVLTMLSEGLRLRAEGILNAFLEGTKTSRDSKALLTLVLCTSLLWLTIILGFLAVFRAFPATSGFGFMEVLILLGFVAFGGILQIPGVGGGMQISTIIVLTEIFGLPLEPATGIAIVFWALNATVIVPLGLSLALAEGLNWRSLRRIQDIEKP